MRSAGWPKPTWAIAHRRHAVAMQREAGHPRGPYMAARVGVGLPRAPEGCGFQTCLCEDYHGWPASVAFMKAAEVGNSEVMQALVTARVGVDHLLRSLFLCRDWILLQRQTFRWHTVPWRLLLGFGRSFPQDVDELQVVNKYFPMSQTIALPQLGSTPFFSRPDLSVRRLFSWISTGTMWIPIDTHLLLSRCSFSRKR
jgi:hypothetical protein